jgi:hypothetical protein
MSFEHRDNFSVSRLTSQPKICPLDFATNDKAYKWNGKCDQGGKEPPAWRKTPPIPYQPHKTQDG